MAYKIWEDGTTSMKYDTFSNFVSQLCLNLPFFAVWMMTVIQDKGNCKLKDKTELSHMVQC